MSHTHNIIGYRILHGTWKLISASLPQPQMIAMKTWRCHLLPWHLDQHERSVTSWLFHLPQLRCPHAVCSRTSGLHCYHVHYVDIRSATTLVATKGSIGVAISDFKIDLAYHEQSLGGGSNMTRRWHEILARSSPDQGENITLAPNGTLVCIPSTFQYGKIRPCYTPVCILTASVATVFGVAATVLCVLLVLFLLLYIPFKRLGIYFPMCLYREGMSDTLPRYERVVNCKDDEQREDRLSESMLWLYIISIMVVLLKIFIACIYIYLYYIYIIILYNLFI
jgi:hypothetical protein